MDVEPFLWWPIGINQDSPDAELLGAFLPLGMPPSANQAHPNDPIAVFEGPIEMREGEDHHQEEGKLAYEFLPSPGLVVHIPSPQHWYGHVDADIQILPAGADAAAHLLLTSSGGSLGEKMVIHPVSGVVDGAVRFGTSERIGRVRFHLLNFVPFIGGRVFNWGGRPGPTWWHGRASFAMGPWRVTIDALPDARERLQHAEKVRGYALTHVGNLEKQPEERGIPKLFGMSEAEKALDVLRLVFTFANGARCPCVLPYAYRHMPSEISKWVIGNERIAPALHHGNWFSKYAPSECFGFADKLYELWKHEDERSWLVSAISLYVEANHFASGVDIELVKSQIALELVAWVACQERKMLFTPRTFEEMPAADKIRSALLWAEIPTDLPQDMVELRQVLSQLRDGESGPFDGPFCVTQFRNAAIHPTRHKRRKMAGIDDLARYQAWKLSQDYVALLILRLLGYAGPYMPHYRRQQTPDSAYPPGPSRSCSYVPWARNC